MNYHDTLEQDERDQLILSMTHLFRIIVSFGGVDFIDQEEAKITAILINSEGQLK